MSTGRLVERPVFLLSCIRSGSTLLRAILNSHSLICSPHELHLGQLAITTRGPHTAAAMAAAGLDTETLQHLLWDRVLHQLLTASGKKIIVEKTPGNALIWQRLAQCWPHARFIVLQRDPADILASAIEARPDRDLEHTTAIVSDLAEGVDRARDGIEGHFVCRYEDLAGDPANVISDVCGFLGVAYEPQMLQYQVPQVLAPGIGDFTAKIRTGQVQGRRTGSPVAEGTLAELRNRWGYGDA